MAVSVLFFESDGEDSVASRRLNNPDASRFQDLRQRRYAVIAFVSKSEADCRTLREVAGLMSQSAVSCADVQQARRAIRWHDPKIVVCEAHVRDGETGRNCWSRRQRRNR